MTSINSYYQLANALTGQNNFSSSNSLSANKNNETSTTQSLIDALNAANGTGSQSSSNSAYSLSLSPQAQQLLGSSSSSSSVSSSFTLTNSQQDTIKNILKQFSGQPLTQDTYDKIQQALQKAGLSANQLMAQDEITNLASPQTLIDDLNGNINTAVINPSHIISSEQTKTSNYMDAIVKEWQSMNASSTSSTATDTISQS